ncbi:unnamed protein product, partial [Iphiclides podalirius]
MWAAYREQPRRAEPRRRHMQPNTPLRYSGGTTANGPRANNAYFSSGTGCIAYAVVGRTPPPRFQKRISTPAETDRPERYDNSPVPNPTRLHTS